MHIRHWFTVATAATFAFATAGAQRIATDLTGSWLFSVVTENGTGTPIVVLRQTGDSLSGTYESSRMGKLEFKGLVKDKGFEFTIVTEGGANLIFTGEIVDADHVKGDVDFGGMGGATFTGERRKTGAS